jgi:S-(hydroxymethyl)glutathione dehydrogenase/alcohol dehydrogenase
VALIGCGVTTGLGAVFNTARGARGITAVVIGCGGIGLSVIQGCRIAGAGRIIAVDTAAWKLELATRLGATDVVGRGPRETRCRPVVEMTAGGANYAFEAIGTPPTVRQAVRMARKGGTIIMIGVVPAGVSVELPGADIVLREKRSSAA